MLAEEQKQSHEAEVYIKAHRDALIAHFASEEIYVPDLHPVSIFMAGSPGSGKTEVSKRLMERFTSKPVRIDADEIRVLFPGYTGANAHIFQSAATIGVNKLYDHILKMRLNVVLDGTFAYRQALKNVERSLQHNRKVEIYYLYQDPVIAWEVTRKREALEHRNVSKDVFIEAFFLAREHIDAAKEAFGDQIIINLIVKNFLRNTEEISLNVQHIDQNLGKEYTRDIMERILI